MMSAAGRCLSNNLERFGDAVAAVDDRGARITYAELVQQADSIAASVGSEQQLLLLEATNTVEWLIGYVAGLRGGHSMLIAPAAAPETMVRLAAQFRPAHRLLAANGYRPEAVPAGGGMVLHPDLTIMLSTSGSTGSSKCVRLSDRNIVTNAAAIATYLEINSDDRGAVNLPTHYSYGLSIVNSHLYVGATMLLTSRSVVDAEFWSFLRNNSATSFAGVPHVYDLLEKINFAASAPDTLRYFTQAGGRLSTGVVTRYAERAEQLGIRFYVMYGQTEATARMAYLPPEKLASNSDCIGIAIPGGRLTLVDENGAEVTSVETDGELIYEGPNVMMGYAVGPEELGDEPGPDRLATGDIARRTAAGLFRITGRQSRFVKIFGNRLGLDDIERLLGDAGYPVITTGTDDRLLVVTRQASAPQGIAMLLAEQLKLPPAYFEIRVVQEFPLLPSGKIDYASLKATIVPHKPLRSRWWQPRGRPSASNVQAVFFEVFGESARDGSATFNSLGGDSLNYVLVVTGLELLIPDLPPDWETRSIAALTALSAPQVIAGKVPRLPTNVDTLRGLACLLVVAYHVIGYNDTTGLRLPQSSTWHYAVDSFDYVRMPMFTALAGMIYAAMPATREGLAIFVARKLRQIIVPLLFATLVVWALRRVAYGLDESLMIAYRDGYQHLWYLYALMLMFIIAGLGDTYLGKSPKGWGIALLAVIITRPWLPHVELFAFSNMVHLLPFFILGMLLYREPVLLRSSGVAAGAITIAACTLGLQQATMWGIVDIAVAWPYLEYACSSAIVIAALRLTRRTSFLEQIAAYSYTIYLWHPVFNAIARAVLIALGLRSTWELFLLGMAAGTMAPIALHLGMLRLPRLRVFVIGR